MKAFGCRRVKKNNFFDISFIISFLCFSFLSFLIFMEHGPQGIVSKIFLSRINLELNGMTKKESNQ